MQDFENPDFTGAERCAELADVFAFLGNSLLVPMSQTASVGLDPLFWEEFPCFGSDAVQQACLHLAGYARNAALEADPVTAASVEFTQLFVGPPKPAAFPWESYYVAEGVTSGFGEPTYQMQRLLRAYGLEISHGEGTQLADHIGIELLLLSELYRRASEGALELAEVRGYVAEHPGKWTGKLRASAREAAPRGYVPLLLELAGALLEL